MHMVNGKPELKLKHQYFYQCQGVMGICDLTELDFIVYTEKRLYVQTIQFDEKLWKEKMLPKLTTFYFDFF